MTNKARPAIARISGRTAAEKVRLSTCGRPRRLAGVDPQAGGDGGFEKRKRMTNIPTDLLRTFVLVVEQRSFTRAAKAQGMTQPAISAQIRRLQSLLGVELFDKSAPGVALTPMGQHVIDTAHRLLSVNDHIMQIASPNATAQLIRIGVRKDCMGEELTAVLAATRARWPNLRCAAQGAGQRRLLQYLNQDKLDIDVTLVPDEPEGSARHYWPEELAWVRGKTTTLDLSAPIPLIGYKDRCMCHRV